MKEFARVSIIGLGYIGLPTAAMFASRKMPVIGVDVNEDAVRTINSGGIHIVEPDLDMIVRAAVNEGYLKATTRPEPADAFIVAVPTPFTGDDHQPDLGFIRQASRAIAPVLARGNLVILESTSPVGATERMAEWLAEARPDLTFPQSHGGDSDIRIAHCPERVLPGSVMRELVANDRVIGGMTPRCAEAALALYRVFVRGECFCTTARMAEMAKLTENSFRDVNIAFANELSIICDEMGIDVWELTKLANRHPRVNILQPGPGVGGHCIAVDPWFIISQFPQTARLIRTAREVNDAKPGWVVEKVRAAIAQRLMAEPERTAKDVTVACYGLAYKPDIDDLRESASLAILRGLAAEHPGAVLAVEPNISRLPSVPAKVELMRLDDAARMADVHVILVAHREFRSFDWSTVRGAIIDVQGVAARQ